MRVMNAPFTKERIQDRIKVLKKDKLLKTKSYPASVDTNAPLALIQVSLVTELHTLQRVIGQKCTKVPIK